MTFVRNLFMFTYFDNLKNIIASENFKSDLSKNNFNRYLTLDK